MMTIFELSQLSAAARTAEYKRAKGAHIQVCIEERGVSRPNAWNSPYAKRSAIAESAYQTACAVMCGIWDDNVRSGAFIARVSDADAQAVIDAAVAARRAEIAP